MRCRYCDTPASRTASASCMAQTSPGAPVADERVPNPVSAALLSGLCARLAADGPARSTISLTGGEPLLQLEFLAEWLPLAKKHHRVYLETSGIHFDAMQAIRDAVDVVSMDFKLPSATGLRPFWDEHERFLYATANAGLFVKAVVTGDTDRADILVSARLIAGRDTSIPLVLQPASGPLAPAPEMLLAFQDAALGILPDVRVIPQAHKMLGVR